MGPDPHQLATVVAQLSPRLVPLSPSGRYATRPPTSFSSRIGGCGTGLGPGAGGMMAGGREGMGTVKA